MELKMTGLKFDSGKPEPRLVLGTMARAILAVSQVATFGAKKYSADNWLKVEDGLSRYTDAKDRHRLEGAIDERDTDSGLLHAAHEAWNALAVLELKLRAIAQSAETGNHVSSSGDTEPCMILDEIELEDWARYVTTDSDGQRFQYAGEPRLADDGFNWDLGENSTVCSEVDHVEPPADYTKTLIKL